MWTLPGIQEFCLLIADSCSHFKSNVADYKEKTLQRKIKTGHIINSVSRLDLNQCSNLLNNLLTHQYCPIGQILFSSLTFCWTQKHILTYLRFLIASYISLFHMQHFSSGILLLDSSLAFLSSKCINIHVSGQTNVVSEVSFSFSFLLSGFVFVLFFGSMGGVCLHTSKSLGLASQLFPAGLRLEWTSWSFSSYKVWKWNFG